jgi:hypothetical protein
MHTFVYLPLSCSIFSAQKYHQPPPTRAIEEEVFGDYTAMQPESSISAIGDDENDENSGGTLHNQPTGDNYMPMKSSESKCHPPQEDYTQMDRGGATDDTDGWSNRLYLLYYCLDDTRLIDGAEYTPMDVASCSSGSASHLAVPSTCTLLYLIITHAESFSRRTNELESRRSTIICIG